MVEVVEVESAATKSQDIEYKLDKHEPDGGLTHIETQISGSEGHFESWPVSSRVEGSFKNE